MGNEAAADPRLLARALAALRIFVGVIAFSNGLAKLFSSREIDIGPYFGTLVDRPEAHQILDFEINQRGGGTDLPLLPTVVNDVILPSYDVQQWLLTFTELGTGALLIVGLFSRGAALVVFAQHFFLQLVYFSSGPLRFRTAARVAAALHPRARARRTGLGPRRPPRPQPADDPMALIADPRRDGRRSTGSPACNPAAATRPDQPSLLLWKSERLR